MLRPIIKLSVKFQIQVKQDDESITNRTSKSEVKRKKCLPKNNTLLSVQINKKMKIRPNKKTVRN